MKLALTELYVGHKLKKNSVMNNEQLPKTIKSNREKVFEHLQNEQNKVRFDVTINEEYTQKVILYGYVLVNSIFKFIF